MRLSPARQLAGEGHLQFHLRSEGIEYFSDVGNSKQRRGYFKYMDVDPADVETLYEVAAGSSFVVRLRFR
jgi:hypothetical protein